MENYQESTKPSLVFRLNNKSVMLTILSLVLLLSMVTVYKLTKVTSTISVIGQSEILANPDFLKMVVTYVNQGGDVSSVIDMGTSGVNKLIAVAKELGGDKIEIKQTAYQVTLSETGFTVANAFSIKTANINIADDLVKKLYTNGATSVSSITFESNDIKNVEEKLRSQVYLDAKVKAKRIAKSAGKRLGKVVSIVDDDTTITSTVMDLKDNNLINISKTASVIYKIW